MAVELGHLRARVGEWPRQLQAASLCLAAIAAVATAPALAALLMLRRLLQPPLPTPPAAFDEERRDLLARLEACAGPPPSEHYKLAAESRQRAAEVRDLQKALSDAHTYLFEERERLLSLQVGAAGVRARAGTS